MDNIILTYSSRKQNIKRRLYKRGSRITSSSRRYLLRTRLQSVKDKTARKTWKKSGICKVSCPNCDKIYEVYQFDIPKSCLAA